MNGTKLKITRRAPSWGPDAREGRLTHPDGTSDPVLVWILPDVPANADALAGLQRQARALAKVRNPALARLLNVSIVGDNAALVYEWIEGASLDQVLAYQRARGAWLPVKVCVELAAQVAQAIAAAIETTSRGGDALRVMHPGPSPADVLIDTDGNVRLAGLVVLEPQDIAPTTAIPGYTPPEGPGSPASTVYGIAALALEMLSGAPPPPAGASIRLHDEAIREAMRRMGERPGEPVPRGIAQLIRLSMSGNPGLRPPPMAVATQLTQVANALRGPGVPAWAGATIDRVMEGVASPPVRPLPSGPPPMVEPTVRQSAPPQRPPAPPPPPPAPPPPAAAPPPPQPPAPIQQALADNRVSLKEEVDDEPTVKAEGVLDEPAGLPAEPEPTQESTDALASAEPEPSEPAFSGGVGPGLFRSGAPPLASEHDPAVEATVTVGRAGEKLPPDTEPELELGAPVAQGPAEPEIGFGAPLPDQPEPAPHTDALDDDLDAPPRRGPNLLLIAAVLIAGILAGGGAVMMMSGGSSTDGSETVAAEDPPADPPADPPVALPEDPPEDPPEDDGVADAPAPVEPAEPPPPAERSAPPEPTPPARSTPSPERTAPATTPDPAPEEPDVTARLGAPADPPAEPDPKPDPPAEPDPPPKADPPAAASSGPFDAIFTIGDPSVTALTVKCFAGTPSGTGPVVVKGAEPGPCRIQGRTDSGGLVAFFELKGPGTYTCFQGGARSCQ
ncbi:MAG: hypothetical protein H6739_13325 [Alphaproteobacteria bacterium]|nr:hypothetical protein [Alphaproteobacteria bacterium]